MNRHERRALRHDLRRLGCTCEPSVVGIPRSEWPPMVTLGAMVHHQVGCILGDVVEVKNRAGIMPAIIATSSGRCDR